MRHAHRPDDALLQVILPAEGIDEAFFFVIGHGIDGKIPPGKILPHIRHKVHFIRVAAVGVCALRAEGSDLVQAAALLHRDRTVLQTGGNAAFLTKQVHHLLRQGAGAQVPVVGAKPQQTVPHTAAHGIGRIARCVQRIQQHCCAGAQCQLHYASSSYCRRMLLPSKPHSAAGKMLCARNAYSSGSVIIGE